MDVIVSGKVTLTYVLTLIQRRPLSATTSTFVPGVFWPVRFLGSASGSRGLAERDLKTETTG